MNPLKTLALASLLLLHPALSLASPSVQVGFSPEGGAQRLVLQIISRANKSIHMIGYSFQAPDIAQALVAAGRRGVDVQIVVDKRRNAGSASKKQMDYVARNGIHLRIDGHYHIQHDKMMVIDDRIVETGSFNFAPSAETENSENVVVMRGMPGVVRQYQTHWASRWALGVPWHPAREAQG